jgi:AAA+ superfamily predicted ATPase
LAALNEEIAELETAHQLPLVTACKALGLDEFQKAAVITVAAPHLDHSIREAIAHFWGHSNRHHVDGALIVELFCADSLQRVSRATQLRDGAVLHAAGLIESTPAQVPYRPSELEQELVPTPRLLRLLDGQVGMDPRFRTLAAMIVADREAAIGVMEPGHLHDTALLLVAAEAVHSHGGVALFAGTSGCGKLRLAQTMCAVALQAKRLLVVEASQLPADPGRLAKSIEALAHEAQLLGARLVLRRVDLYAVDARSSANLRHAMNTCPVTMWLTSDIDPTRIESPSIAGLANVTVSIGAADVALRREAWRAELGHRELALDEETLRSVASDYPLSRSAIETAARMGHALVKLGRTIESVLPAVAESQMLGQLGRFAKRSRSRARIDDVVLTEHTREQVLELLTALRRRRSVHERWGLADRHAIGRGIVALFNGPPGTGKSLTAAALANEIEMPLYRIDASSILDRYVGETEKNLVRLFDEAAASRAALLFDEADALFGKRVEAADASDRYANLQINTLLNLIEDYDGFVVLTTNIKGALDDAFLRRIIYKISYEKPDVDELVALWEYHLPPSITRSRDVDTAALAEEFDQLAGGDIKNAVLRATLGAPEGEAITQDMLRRAVISELRANGSVVAG